MLMVKSKLNKI